MEFEGAPADEHIPDMVLAERIDDGRYRTHRGLFGNLAKRSRLYPTLVDGRGDVLVELLQPLGHRQLEHIAVRQR